MKILFAFFAVLAPMTFGWAEPRVNCGQDADVRIEKRKPTIYIAFERAGKRAPLNEGESNQGIWLRLHNNTHWPIEVATFDVPKAFGEVGLYYDVVSEERTQFEGEEKRPVDVDQIPRGYMHTDGYSTIRLKPGKSWLFSVPSEHLAKHLFIQVMFDYEWESENGETTTEPRHYVSFHWWSLPQRIWPIK